MNKTLSRAIRLSRLNSEYYCRRERRCLTPDAVYKTKIKPHKVSCKVVLPPNVRLHLTESEAQDLDESIHRAMESVLSKFFKGQNLSSTTF